LGNKPELKSDNDENTLLCYYEAANER